MKRSAYQNHSTGKSIAFGAIGGFVAGLVMIPLLMLTSIMTGMPADTFPIAVGTVFGAAPSNAMMVGIGIHLLASIIIGIIFGAVTANVDRLKITGFGKGIVEGLITGMIAFVVLFIPAGMLVLPPVLANMMVQMNPSMTQQQAMALLQQRAPISIGMGIVQHLVYGAVLGAITSALVLRVKRKEERKAEAESTNVAWTDNKGSGNFVCSACQKRFDNLQEREDHIRVAHHGAAA